MNPEELVEWAALVSNNGPTLLTQHSRLSHAGLIDYWSASKCRADQWNRTIKDHRKQTTSKKSDPPGYRSSIVRVFEEVFSSEILTRVWAAVVTAHDRYYQNDEGEAIVCRTLAIHSETRNAVLQCLLYWLEVGSREVPHCYPTAVALNRYRGQSERWNDLLIGHLFPLGDVSEFAFDKKRAQEFRHDAERSYRIGSSHQTWPLTLASLRRAFRTRRQETSPNVDLNTRITMSILGCFGPETFDSIGITDSLWMTRLANHTHDISTLIDEALDLNDSKFHGMWTR